MTVMPLSKTSKQADTGFKRFRLKINIYTTTNAHSPLCLIGRTRQTLVNARRRGLSVDFRMLSRKEKKKTKPLKLTNQTNKVDLSHRRSIKTKTPKKKDIIVTKNQLKKIKNHYCDFG